jgi:prophage tail gpP-like protein
MSDDLTLTVGGSQLSGWTDVSLTRVLLGMPNSFRIAATDPSPLASAAQLVQAGQACSVQLGADTVITGYIDAVEAFYGPGGSGIAIEGRGKCQDLVDCSAEWPNSQVSGTSALDIATKLAAVYGITVKNNGPAGPAIPQFNINIGDTPQDIIERVTRLAALLYYEDQNGNLVLDQAGSTQAASGFTEGVNIERLRYRQSMNERYSDYWASMLSVNTTGLFENNDGLFFGHVQDPNVKRHRTLYLVAEAVEGGIELAQNRVKWECARRYGRSRALEITADSWRDSAGTLWTPNTLAPVVAPRAKLSGERLCIASVTYQKGLTGTHAVSTLMPKEAFLPQPIVLQPQIMGITPVGPATNNAAASQ